MLDISKVQMARFLNGSSHPKPVVLERICAFFSVDARILIEPLSDKQLQMLRDGQGLRMNADESAIDQSMTDGISYMMGKRAPFHAKQDLLDGFYLLWRHSKTFPALTIKIPLLIKSYGDAKVVRGLEPQFFPGQGAATIRTVKDREFKGIVQGDAAQIAIIFIEAWPSKVLSFDFAHAHHSPLRSSQMVGLSVVVAPEYADSLRFSRNVIEYLPGGISQLLPHARQGHFMKAEDTPPDILELINKPIM